MTKVDIAALVARVEAAEARAAAAEAKVVAASTSGELTCKVNQSGGLYVRKGKVGVNMFPNQWELIAANFKAIDAWVKANRASLSQGKDDPRYATKA